MNTSGLPPAHLEHMIPANDFNILMGLAIIVVADDDPMMDDVGMDEAVLDSKFLFVRQSLWHVIEPDLKKRIAKVVS